MARGAKPGERRGGRQKGTPNKITRTLKETILGALKAEGGVNYLRSVARETPTVFCALLAKVLPLTVVDEKVAEVPMVTKINFIGMEPVPFGGGEPTALEKLPVKQTCD
jgi:hypothetical protein